MWKDSPQDGSIVPVCKNGDVELKWSVNLPPGHTIASLGYVSIEGLEPKILHIQHDASNFQITTFPGISLITKGSTNAGVIFKGVTKEGMYGVHVLVTDTYGRQSLIKRKVYVKVFSDLMTASGKLDIEYEGKVAVNSDGSSTSLVVKCGQFYFDQSPPFSLEWMTPSGEVVPSSGYKDGYFYLNVPTSNSAYGYVCRVPTQDAHKACITN